METLFKDLRYGARMLLKKPGFTLVAVLTLALGIGANTAIFSVFDAVLLKPLPYEDPDRIMMVWEKPPATSRNSVSAANFLDWKNQNQVFEQMAARSNRNFNLSGLDRPEKVRGWLVSANYFDLLGVKAAFGRTFSPEEDQPGEEQVVVLSHRLWQQRFGADPKIIGNAVTLDGEKYTVVGILKPDSSFDRAVAEIYAPIAFDPAQVNRRSHFLMVFARLKQDVTIEQAGADMGAIASTLAEQYPDTNKGWGVTIDLLRDRVISKELQQTIIILFGAVIFILLIACANLANLTLARATSRQKEISIRAALGASRLRLGQQFLTESLMLALMGGALGALFGLWLIDLFTALMPPDILPPEAQVSLDNRVLLFTLGLSLITGVIFGMVPAWQASKPDLNEALKEGGKGSTAGGSRKRLGNLLIISEVALALVLLIGSGLLIRSLFSLQKDELGFQPENVLTMHVSLPSTKYRTGEQVTAYYGEAIRQIKSLPGIEQAGIVTDLPIVGWSYGMFFSIEGRPPAGSTGRRGAHLQTISEDYFRSLSIPLLRGRSFNERDNADATPVIIINDTMARRHFPDEDPLGKYLIEEVDPPVRYEIVGIVANVKVYGLGDQVADESPEVYVPFAQSPRRDMYFAARTSGAPMQMANAALDELQAIDKDQPVTSVRSLEQVVSGSLSDEWFNTLLLGIFAAVAMMLAAIGIYGIISYTVSQHTREIGIRMALGAQKRDVLKLIVGQGMVLVVIGVAIGLGAAFALTRAMESMLFKVSATDPITFAITPLLLTGVALAACYIPARRATKVDPMEALRYE